MSATLPTSELKASAEFWSLKRIDSCILVNVDLCLVSFQHPFKVEKSLFMLRKRHIVRIPFSRGSPMVINLASLPFVSISWQINIA